MKTYYVYLNHPYERDLIGSGTKEECQAIKAKKDAEWQVGYLWDTEISDEEKEVYSMFD